MIAEELIPDECSSLDEVIHVFYIAETRDAAEIQKSIESATTDEARDEAIRIYDRKSLVAIELLLEQLRSDGLRGYIRDPKTSGLLRISPHDWPANVRFTEGSGAFWRIFIRPESTFIGGAWRSIFFKDEDVRAWLDANYPNSGIRKIDSNVYRASPTTAGTIRTLGPRPNSGTKKQQAWDAIKKYFPDGIPETLSAQKIANELKEKMIAETPSLTASLNKNPPFSQDTIRRVLSGD